MQGRILDIEYRTHIVDVAEKELAVVGGVLDGFDRRGCRHRGIVDRQDLQVDCGEVGVQPVVGHKREGVAAVVVGLGCIGVGAVGPDHRLPVSRQRDQRVSDRHGLRVGRRQGAAEPLIFTERAGTRSRLWGIEHRSDGQGDRRRVGRALGIAHAKVEPVGAVKSRPGVHRRTHRCSHRW